MYHQAQTLPRYPSFILLFCAIFAFPGMYSSKSGKTLTTFKPNHKGYLFPLLRECNHSRGGQRATPRTSRCPRHVFWRESAPFFFAVRAESAVTTPPPSFWNPRWFKSSLNPRLSSPPPAYCDCPVTFLHKGTVSTRRTDERTRGWAGAQIPLWFRSSTGRYSALPWHAKISH